VYLRRALGQTASQRDHLEGCRLNDSSPPSAVAASWVRPALVRHGRYADTVDDLIEKHARLEPGARRSFAKATANRSITSKLLSAATSSWAQQRAEMRLAAADREAARRPHEPPWMRMATGTTPGAGRW
jgi:hypothetical protein